MAVASFQFPVGGQKSERFTSKSRDLGHLVLVIEGDKRVLEYLQSLLAADSFRDWKAPSAKRGRPAGCDLATTRGRPP